MLLGEVAKTSGKQPENTDEMSLLLRLVFYKPGSPIFK
jgi:hypothetical protein